MTGLPIFRYHPDPVLTGAVTAAPVTCACCGRERSHTYGGPVYAVGAHHGRLCPWCIADGSAHLRLGATFTDEAGIGGGGAWEAVSDEVVREVATRTPGCTKLDGTASSTR